MLFSVTFKQILFIMWVMCGLADIFTAYSKKGTEGYLLLACVVTLFYGFAKLLMLGVK